MAHHKSAKKRIRRNSRRADINGDRRNRTRSFVKNVEAAIETGDKAAAQEALRAAQPELAKSANRGVFHRNTVARKMSRLSARVKAMA